VGIEDQKINLLCAMVKTPHLPLAEVARMAADNGAIERDQRDALMLSASAEIIAPTPQDIKTGRKRCANVSDRLRFVWTVEREIERFLMANGALPEGELFVKLSTRKKIWVDPRIVAILIDKLALDEKDAAEYRRLISTARHTCKTAELSGDVTCKVLFWGIRLLQANFVQGGEVARTTLARELRDLIASRFEGAPDIAEAIEPAIDRYLTENGLVESDETSRRFQWIMKNYADIFSKLPERISTTRLVTTKRDSGSQKEVEELHRAADEAAKNLKEAQGQLELFIEVSGDDQSPLAPILQQVTESLQKIDVLSKKLAAAAGDTKKKKKKSTRKKKSEDEAEAAEAEEAAEQEEEAVETEAEAEAPAAEAETKPETAAEAEPEEEAAEEAAPEPEETPDAEDEPAPEPAPEPEPEAEPEPAAEAAPEPAPEPEPAPPEEPEPEEGEKPPTAP
jgi:hypothetical protein